MSLSTAFAYLSEIDPLDVAPYDAVIGFGMFDLALPVFCGDLYANGRVRRIVFTGGIGAGTGDLGGPEADVWRAVLRESHPQIPDRAVIVENRSTNTGENVAFTAERLRAIDPALAFGAGLRRVILVASPTRLRRVWLTVRQQQPGLVVTRLRPDVTMEQDMALYARQGIDYGRHVAGELDRIVEYAKRGWIVHESLPAEIESARVRL